MSGDGFRVRLEGVLAEAAGRAGAWLACRVGCTECCIGPFPISQLDAAWLREGWQRLAGADPARAAALRERAEAARASLAADFPGDHRTGLLDDGELRLEAFLARQAALPCPALDPATGACDLYAWRPVPCRTFGPPSRDALGPAPPCRLCFAGAPAAEIERCRVEFDPEGEEDVLVEAAEEAAGRRGDTLVAFALARRLR